MPEAFTQPHPRSQPPKEVQLGLLCRTYAHRRQSESSIRGEYTSHSGNKRLTQTMFLSAFASLRPDPVCLADCDRKIAQGKRSGRTLIALERHCILTLHAMIRNGPLCETPNQHTSYPPPLDTPHRGPEVQDRTRGGD